MSFDDAKTDPQVSPEHDKSELKPCINTFKQLASEDASRLERWIRSGELDPAHLTFAAEYFGTVQALNPEPLLVELMLTHASPVVREGALCGLAHHGFTRATRALVEKISTSDPSKGVRIAAADALESENESSE